MVVDQRTLRANMLRSSIGSNVRNKLTGQQAQTQQTTPTVQQTTDTPITQTRGFQQVQQTPQIPQAQQTGPIDTYKVITNKFPTYDIKDIMGFGPQATKNAIGFMQSVGNYNKLQAQANANTDPNVRYNLTKPELTNKQTLQIQQATPQTNEQGLKINKTASFKDLISDLQYVAGQGKNLSFVEFRELYPEYVENWDKVVDLFESIKSNPQYSAEKVTETAQKAYPELFGINENYSDSDKMSALKRLYDEMVSNKQNGIQLTQQDIIDRYPEYANTEDINTVMKLQDFINKDKKSTPTFIDVYDISKEFKSLTKGDVEVGNTEKEQFKKDLKSIDNIFQSTYNGLSDEGKDYVKLLSIAKAVGDAVRQEYWIPESISDRDILQQLKQSDPKYYNELVGDIDSNTTLSEQDRKLLDNNGTLKSAGQSLGRSIVAQGVDQVIQLGKGLLTKIENGELLKGNKVLNTNPLTGEEYGNGDIFGYQKMINNNENLSKLSEKVDTAGKKFLGDLQTELGWMEEDFKNTDMYKKFESESGKKIKTAIKDGDWGAVANNMGGVIGQTLPALVVGYLTKGKGFTTQKLAEFSAFALPSYQRAMEDIESDESLSGLTAKEKDELATRMATIESVIETASLSNMFPGLSEGGGIISKIPGMKNVLLRTLVQTQIGAAGESLEEVTQEFFNNLLAKNAGSDRDMGELKDYWDIFTETYLSSQLISALGGATEGINQAQINSLQKQITEQADLRNKVLEGQAIMANDFNEFANAVEVVPGTTTEELQQVWNNAQQKKQELEEKANKITSNSYNNVNIPTYERTQINESENKLSAKESQEYTDLLDEMEKNGEITKEDRKKVEEKLGIFTRNVEQPKAEGLANIQKTNETKSETSTEEKRNIIDRIVDKGASIVTKTVSAQDKLYKAQEPRMNVLSNKKNLEKRRANSDRANELIVENGYKPTNTEERLNAHQATLNKLWDQVKEQVKQGEGITVDQTPIINALSEYIAEKKKLGIAGIESEIKALERELNAMKKSQEQGKTDLPVLEQKKQVFNDMIDWKEQEASEVYKGGLRLLTHEIGKVEDDLISKIPGEFTKLKQDVGALLDTYEDVFKAHMKNQRSKGIGLTETYSRIEGIGDMLQGIIGVFKGEGGKVISGAGKVLLGKSLARAKDVDFLIKKGFEELSNEMGSNTKNDNDTTTDKNDTPPTKPNKPKNNGPKDQSPSETEKKSEKKTDKAEQVQAKKKNNQNTKPKTKGLAKINETKEETKTEGLANVSKEQTEEKHFTYDEYGEVMDKIDTVQKQINEKLDKQYDQERADLIKRFNELKDKNNKTDAEGKELQQLANQLNNLTNKYDRLKEEELAKQAPELLEQKNELQKAFDRDWTAMIDEKMNEINKPYNDLREEYQEKIRKELGLPENTRLTEKIYKGLTAEELEKVSKIQKEYEGKVKELENKEQTTKEETETQQQEGLAAISVKVENGKVVKESEIQENKDIETPQEFEVLPADVRVSDEEKQIGSKRIAPDRVPRQQTTYQGGIDKVYEKVKTIAEYMRVTDKYYSKDGHRDQNIAERFKKLRTDVQNILYGNEGFRFASDKSKEFKELWKNISDNKMLVAPLKEIAKNFYISRVKKDISKGYVYPQEVLEQIPGAEKAVNARQRYEKGLDTSFSAKDNRIDYSEKDVIGAGIKSQDGKQVTNEQKQDIVKGIQDFGKTMGLDMKKFAEDRGLVYVHLHGGSPFLSTFGGMYREATSEQGDKNISVSVGGAENIRYKDKKTKERKTETLNTTMSHELGHAMDYLVDKRLLSWEQKSILRTKFNPVNRLYDYYSRPTEITARAIEQYVAIENGQADYYEENGNLDAGEFKGTDMEYYLKEIGSYYERPGYWNKSDYENYVKPYVEEAFKNNFNEYKTDTIGGKDINQIKQEAVQRGLAEINNF